MMLALSLSSDKLFDMCLGVQVCLWWFEITFAVELGLLVLQLQQVCVDSYLIEFVPSPRMFFVFL